MEDSLKPWQVSEGGGGEQAAAFDRLEQELADAYDTYQRQQELTAEFQRAEKYRAGMILLGLLLLIVLVLWLVV